METSEGSCGAVGNMYTKPEILFLRRILMEELAYQRNNHERLVIAVHSVFLESGLVPVDPISGNQSDDYRIHSPYLFDKWKTLNSTMSVSYTLSKNNHNCNKILLKFQKSDDDMFVNVDGSLSCGRFEPLRLRLYEPSVAPLIFVCAKRNGGYGDGDDYWVSNIEKEISQFWKTIKDEIVLPLMIELCSMAGLPGPTTLMGLPVELRMKIFRLMDADDVSRVAIVCKELKNMVNDIDELWGPKFDEEAEISSNDDSDNNEEEEEDDDEEDEAVVVEEEEDEYEEEEDDEDEEEEEDDDHEEEVRDGQGQGEMVRFYIANKRQRCSQPPGRRCNYIRPPPPAGKSDGRRKTLFCGVRDETLDIIYPIFDSV